MASDLVGLGQLLVALAQDRLVAVDYVGGRPFAGIQRNVGNQQTVGRRDPACLGHGVVVCALDQRHRSAGRANRLNPPRQSVRWQ